jgi:hypothetical protein
VTTPTGLSTNQVISFSLLVFADLNHGANTFSYVSLNGTPTTVLWPDGIAPTASIGGTDFYSFTIIKNTEGVFSILATHVNYV